MTNDCHNRDFRCINSNFCYIQGPTGPTGPRGPSSISIGKTITGEAGDIASVVNVGSNDEMVLEFVIPQGATGPKGEMGPIGPQGEPGIIGATGPRGIADTIIIGSVTTGNSDTDAKITDVGNGNVHILDFVIPKGEKGEMGPQGEKGVKGDEGPAGPEKLPATYIVSYRRIDFPEEGEEVEVKAPLPMHVREIDTANLSFVDTNNNTVKFSKTGFYKITFTVSGYADGSKKENFDPTKDFISVGFGITGTDNIYIGASGFTPNGIATQIVAQGIITVVDTNNTYQLVNLGKTKLRLEAPHIENLNTGSYFVNSVVTIIVEYLGVAPDNP